MESLLCNEVLWLMSPNNYNVQETNDEYYRNNAKDGDHVLITTTSKEDCEEALGVFLGKEATYMPKPGYFNFIKTNHIIHNARFKAVNWLFKSQRRMNLSPGTAFLAVNYIDRFISLTDQCQGWKYWTFELLSVACLSIASKFNETTTCLRLLHELIQVEGVDNCFAPTLIQRMELTVLKALGWRMDSTTPFSYVRFLIIQSFIDHALIEDFTILVTELLVMALLDPEFLEFQQCVMAMSAVRCVFEDLFPSINNDSLAHLYTTVIPHDQKDDLIRCQRIMAKLLVRDHKMLDCGKKFLEWLFKSSNCTEFI